MCGSSVSDGRRVHVLGSTPHPESLFMQQVVRQLTLADGAILEPGHTLICDRDSKWGADVRRDLADAGVHMVVTSMRAPNANAYGERFVRSITEGCLDRMTPLGERHFLARWRSSPSTIMPSETTKGSATCSSPAGL